MHLQKVRSQMYVVLYLQAENQMQTPEERLYLHAHAEMHKKKTPR